MKLRVKHLENIGYFSQVKTGFSGWKNIGKHLSGYGLYSESHAEFPLEIKEEAVLRCKAYERWILKITQKPTYFDVS